MRGRKSGPAMAGPPPTALVDYLYTCVLWNKWWRLLHCYYSSCVYCSVPRQLLVVFTVSWTEDEVTCLRRTKLSVLRCLSSRRTCLSMSPSVPAFLIIVYHSSVPLFISWSYCTQYDGPL